MKLIFSILAATWFSSAHANTVVQVDGTPASEIIQDLGLTSNIPTQVHLVGFITEKRTPAVEYYDLTVSYRDHATQPSLTTAEKTALGELFENLGFKPAVQSGGTTYLTFDLVVECLAGSCTIRDNLLPGTPIPQSVSCRASKMYIRADIETRVFGYKNVLVSSATGEDLLADGLTFVDNGPNLGTDQGKVKSSAYQFNLGSGRGCVLNLPNQLVGNFRTQLSCSDNFSKLEDVNCTMGIL